MKYVRQLVFVALFLVNAASVFAAPPKPVKPATRDKCSVCGMFVAKYPDFAAQIHFKNGSVAHFDGSKDLFKFYLEPGRYNQKVKLKDITALYVTDYYSLTLVDGFSALYVVDSDVYGPMGKELVPFSMAKEAKEFSRDHKGKRVLSFKEITPAILKGLD